MPAIIPCQPCCTVPQVVNVPGIASTPGPQGAAGVSAFTFTSGSVLIPSVNSTVTINVLNSTWMAIGELLFVSDGTNWGTFQVSSVPSSSTFVGKFLGFPNDSNVGVTIASTATVTPTGQKFTPSSPQAVYGSGTVFELVLADSYLQVGTNPPTITIPDVHSYVIFGKANIKLLSATCANETLSVHLRRTNNTPANLTPTETFVLPSGATLTQGLGWLALPPIFYTPAQANDTIQLWGNLSAQISNYSAGVHAVQVIQTSLFAFQLF